MKRTLILTVLSLAIAGLTPQAQAGYVSYVAQLDGASEAPPNASPGTGHALVEIDLTNHLLHVSVTFSGLLGTTSAAHIHAPTAVAGTGTAGVATQTPSFVGFPLGVSSGSYDHTFDSLDPATYRAGFITSVGGTVAQAEAVLAAALADGTAYLNVHTNLFPSGEIRGFLVPVPEPGSVVLMGVGGLGLLAASRRFRRPATA